MKFYLAGGPMLMKMTKFIELKNASFSPKKKERKEKIKIIKK